jgi:hypothetical protein
LQRRTPSQSVDPLVGLPRSLGDFLINGVQEIDLRCSSTVNGVERGLCNVKAHFREQALQATGLQLTEETITSWLLGQRIESMGLTVELERKYPGTRKRCDLVVTLPGDELFWIEVKYAWKTWFNCDGTSVRNKIYAAYLHGDKYHSHCAAEDFSKLERLTRENARWLGVLLIGTDSKRHSMAADIQELREIRGLAERGWELVAQRTWRDRRCEDFGINCWFWLRSA